MLLVPAAQLVARLPVYRTLIGVVAASDALYGAAVSDPHLSCARPLRSVDAPAGVAALAATLQCGALVIGLPFGAAGLQAEEEHKARQRRVLAALLRDPALAGRGLLACAFVPARQPTAASVAEQHRDNLQWDQTAVEELGTRGEERDAAVNAAVALQLFLDEHCGGWANTFG